MRTRTRLRLLSCGTALAACTALAGCTATAPKGPHTTVTTPKVGKPPPPTSAQAALSSEAFTPYAALGQSHNDGLAPGESDDTLTNTCMHADGYPNYASGFQTINISPDNLAVALPWGTWGLVGGAAEAEQYAFRQPPAAASAEGLPGLTKPGSVLPAEQAAQVKCMAIVQDFINAADAGPLAGIQTLSNDIYNDIRHDAAVNNALRAWSACLAKNGYANYHQPGNFAYNYSQKTPGPESAAVKKAQTAAAVTDAKCTQSTDLAGIYFAVQASYEQQLVNANQQALRAAVHRWRAMYAKELAKIPALLRKAKGSGAATPTP